MKPKSKKVKFHSADSLRLHGTLLVPSGRIVGTLLMVHGITSDRTEWGIFDRVADEVAKDGIASLRFDYRGHGESELASQAISLSGILSDVVCAMAELDERLASVDEPLRRYVMGSSFGGGFAYAAASRDGRVDGAFLLAPVFDYFADIDHCAPKWRSELKRKDHFHYNDLTLGRGLLNESIHFDPLRGTPVKTVIFHGTEDTDVPVELSRAVAAGRDDVELREMDGAGHVLNKPDDLDLEDDASWAYIDEMIAAVRKAMR